MEAGTYANSGGNSNVVGYVIERQAITVRFGDGSAYLYTYASAGREVVEQMKALARAGRGRNSKRPSATWRRPG